GRLTSAARTVAYAPSSRGETRSHRGHCMSTQESGDSSAATAAAPAEDPQQTPIIDARLSDLTVRFGDRFSEDQRGLVRSRIARMVALSVSLRKTPLTNGDEPEIVFVPYRAEEPSR